MNVSDDFYLVLPSNSSMMYYNDNATSCFTTHMSREIRLSGDWSVGLVEIHVPCTITHIQEADAFYTFKLKENDREETYFFAHGIYESAEQLATEINNSLGLRDHLKFESAPFQKGYYMLRRKCSCEEEHYVTFNEKIRRVLGFEEAEHRQTGTFVTSKLGSVIAMANRPASLARAIPDQLYIYTDICEPYTVGDTQAALLRIVSTDTLQFKKKFGSNVVRHFSPAHYIPLLHHSFRSIVIDIRDQHGLRIPFEYGTLTVTLHFRRNR